MLGSTFVGITTDLVALVGRSRTRRGSIAVPHGTGYYPQATGVGSTVTAKTGGDCSYGNCQVLGSLAP